LLGKSWSLISLSTKNKHLIAGTTAAARNYFMNDMLNLKE